jgi:flagellar biogenesis protein FliO
MELAEYLLKLVLSLAVVLAALFLLLPLLLKKFTGLRGFGGKGSFEVKKVSPLSRNIFIVELEVKGKTILLCVSERGADVIYREDDGDSPAPNSSGSDSSGSGAGDTSR